MARFEIGRIYASTEYAGQRIKVLGRGKTMVTYANVFAGEIVDIENKTRAKIHGGDNEYVFIPNGLVSDVIEA